MGQRFKRLSPEISALAFFFALGCAQTVWAGNEMPPVAPTRLKRTDDLKRSDDLKLTGSVSQSALTTPRLSRPDSGSTVYQGNSQGSMQGTLQGAAQGSMQGSAQNSYPGRQPSPSPTGEGGLFSLDDRSVFSSASSPSPRSTNLSTSSTNSSTNSSGSSNGNSEDLLLKRGLQAVGQLGRALSSSPELQSQAVNLLKGLTSKSKTSLSGAASASTSGGTSKLSGGTALGNAGSALSAAASKVPIVGKVLSSQELNLLSNYEIAIVIDKSGSMNETDCPGGVSRWQWCRDQLLSFTAQISPVFKSGITVALFSSNSQIFKNVGFSVVPDIFSKNVPNGGTYMAKPLSQILDDYFERREQNKGATKKLLIEVISDGEPSDKGELIAVISRATAKMVRPDEVRINFLQIGNERNGTEALAKLDLRMVGDEGAQFDIVSVESFNTVVAEGLPRALLDTASK
jgi:hypothetical protein